MEKKEFIKSRDMFIEEFKKSELFLSYKKINEEIYHNEELIKLDKVKEKLISDYSHATNSQEEETILIELGKIIDELNKHDLVKKYYELRKEIKKLLAPIEEEILEKISNSLARN